MAENLGEGYVWIGTRDNALLKGLGRAKKSFQATMTSMDAMARRARWALLIGAGAMGMVSRAAGSFEQSMSRVEALSGASGQALEKLEQQALDLGRTTVFSANQSADAMAAFALAGFDAEKIMASMPATLNLAAAGELEVGEAAEIAAKIMAGMGIEAKDLNKTVDVLAKAFTTAHTDLRELGEAMKYVGPVAKSVGLSLEETVAIIQLMSNAGITGSMAGTSLRRALSALASPTTQAIKLFKGLNVELKEHGRQRDPISILRDLEVALKGVSGEAERTGIVMTMFGQRAGPAMTDFLAKGLAAFERYRDQALLATGTAAEIADKKLDNFFGSLTLLKSAATGLAITFGSKLNPELRAITERITVITNNLASMSSEEITAITNTAGLAAKMLAFVAVLPLVTRGLHGMAGALAALGAGTVAGGPLVVLAGMLTVLAGAWAEASIKGKTFGDVILEQLDFLTKYTFSLRGILDELEETREQQREIEERSDKLFEAQNVWQDLMKTGRALTKEDLATLEKAAKVDESGVQWAASAATLRAKEQALEERLIASRKVFDPGREEYLRDALERTRKQRIHAEGLIQGRGTGASERLGEARIWFRLQQDDRRVRNEAEKRAAARDQAQTQRQQAKGTQRAVFANILGVAPAQLDQFLEPSLIEIQKATKSIAEFGKRSQDLFDARRRGLITPGQEMAGQAALGRRAGEAQTFLQEKRAGARERLQQLRAERAGILEAMEPEERRSQFMAAENFSQHLQTQIKTEQEKKQMEKQRTEALKKLEKNSKDGNAVLREIRDIERAASGWSNT